MEYNNDNNKWFVTLKARPENLLRLFCFHYAGGSASAYRNWIDGLINNVDLIAIEFPGRGTRLNEPLIDNLQRLIDSLYDNFQNFQDTPFVFLGHSLGAVIAFELAYKLQNEGNKNLKHLIVSGSKTPQVPLARRPIYQIQSYLKKSLDIMEFQSNY